MSILWHIDWIKEENNERSQVNPRQLILVKPNSISVWNIEPAITRLKTSFNWEASSLPEAARGC